MIRKTICTLFNLKRLACIYFTLLFMVLVTMLWTLGTWCPDPPHRVQNFPHAAPHHEQSLIKREAILRDKDKYIHQYEKKLKQIEITLRKNNATDSLFKTNITIYIITPTYSRPVQKAELTRLSQTFLHVMNLHWILVEDSAVKTSLVINFLKNSGLSYTHLNIETPADYKLAESDPNWLKPRGVLQRNTGLSWLHKLPSTSIGVVYFADDDNTYDLQVFEEMRSTKKVSVWPVALVGGLRYEGPICSNNHVKGWFTYWKPDRPFPMDMAGFAINLQLILSNPEAKFALRVQRGYQESVLLQKIVKRDELEPRADNCTKILVWHTRTEAVKLKNEAKFKALGLNGSDPNVEI